MPPKLIGNWLDKILYFAWKRLLKTDDDPVYVLGANPQPSAVAVTLYSGSLWNLETKSRKVKALLKLQWDPDPAIFQQVVEETLMHDIFGSEQDFGTVLLDVYQWHAGRIWEFNSLTKDALSKVEALEALSVSTRLRYRDVQKSRLNLALRSRCEWILPLLFATAVKIPVISLQHFCDIHYRFAFDRVLRSGHSKASDITAFLYELCYLQQKTAAALNEYLRLVDYIRRSKKEAMLFNAELNALMWADLVFPYLKATVEKTVALVGSIYNLQLDNMKEHAKRTKALKASLPPYVLETPYWEFFWEQISSESLEELNIYRTGLLHKKGISKLQPHSYVSNDKSAELLLEVFEVMHEQHGKNSAVLVAAFSMLTDNLMELDPEFPDFSLSEICISHLSTM